MVMAQTETSGSALPAVTESKSDMWLGVGYYTLLFLLVCLGVAVIGKILKVYDLSLQMQGKKEHELEQYYRYYLYHFPYCWFIRRLLVVNRTRQHAVTGVSFVARG